MLVVNFKYFLLLGI